MREIGLKYYFSFILIALLFGKVNAQDTAFAYTYGGTSFDEGTSLIQTPDSGYLLVGNTGSFSSTNGNNDIYVVKIDSLGHYEWSKIYGSAENDWASAVCETKDNEAVITGYANSNINNGYDIFLMKIDLSGNLKWIKTYGGSDWDLAYDVKATPDSGFAIAGETYSYGSGQDDGILIKTDSVGNLLWQKTYGGTKSDYFKSLAIAADSGFVLAGGSSSFTTAQFTDAYLVRTDKAGDTLWTKTYGGDSTEFFNDAAIDFSDSSIVAVGASESWGIGDLDLYVVKTKKNGDTVWTKVLSGTKKDIWNSIVVDNIGNYAIIGYTDTFLGNGNDEVYIYRLTPNKSFLELTTFGGFEDDLGNAIIESKEGGYAIVGVTNSFGSGLNDMMFIKTKNDGTFSNYLNIVKYKDSNVVSQPILGIKNHTSSKINSKVYPNPANRIVHIKVSNDIKDYFNIEIYNMQGQVVKQFKNLNKDEVQFQVDKLTDGMYFYSITPMHDQSILYRGKFIIQK